MTHPEIHIVSITQLYRILNEESHDGSAALIATSCDIDTTNIKIPYCIQLFDDLDMEVCGLSMTKDHADSYARFIKALDPNITEIYCCCQTARGRSPAIASALYKYWGDDLAAYNIWSNLSYSPNPHVYISLCESLGVLFKSTEYEALVEANRQSLRKAVQQANRLTYRSSTSSADH